MSVKDDSSKSEEEFMNQYMKDNYIKQIGDNVSSMRKVKIFLHGIIPDNSIELKLENIESDKLDGESKNINKLFYIPYENLSLFNLYHSPSSSDQTSFNINKSFINFLKKKYTGEDSDSQTVIKGKFLNPNQSKEINKKIFTEKLYHGDKLSNDEKYNFITDMYIYSKLFNEVTSNTNDIMTNIFFYPFFDAQKRDSKYTPYILSKIIH